ncbi:MAG TPA: response regulator [Noviherbaspirillum sp.]
MNCAIGHALQTRPEVVLDIGMPSMNGYRVARHLRAKIGLTSSVLTAVTGTAQERDRVTAKRAGFDHHFLKPIDMHMLVALLNRPDQ